MSEREDDMGEWIRNLTTRSVQEQMRSLQRYQKLTQRIMSGELDEQTVREEYMRFAREETTRYVRGLASLSLSYYNALADLNRVFTDRFFEQVMAEEEEAAAGEQAPPQEAEMMLTAPLGQVAGGRFVLSNERAQPADISFLVSEFTGRSQQETFRPPLRIAPPRFRLQPQEEQEVELSLPLLSDLFAAGDVYEATVVVRGYDDLVLKLVVAPTEAEKQEKEARPEVAQPEAERPPDDLTVLLGVGPTYAKRLQEKGINTFADLAALGDEGLQEQFDRRTWQRARRDRWCEQAALAAADDMEGLRELQAEISGGQA